MISFSCLLVLCELPFTLLRLLQGSALLMYLEQQLGDSTAFEQFLARYIKKFSGKSVVTSDWKDFLYESFPQKKSILDGVNWKNWLYDVGVPLNKPKLVLLVFDTIFSLFLINKCTLIFFGEGRRRSRKYLRIVDVRPRLIVSGKIFCVGWSRF